MPVESPVNSIADLNQTYPEHTDGLAQTDSHIRLIKTAIQETFPNIKGAMTTSQTDLSNGYIPIGGIIIWSGATTAIPTNWHLCDGTTGTPDLRDKFVIGAGNNYAVAASGGSSSFSGNTSTDGTHTHQSTGSSTSSSTSTSTSTATPSGTASSSSSSSTDGAHTHPGSTDNALALSVAQLPAHQHNVSVAVGGGNGGPQSGQYNATLGPTNFVTDGGIGLNGATHQHGLSIVSDGNHSHTITTTTSLSLSTTVSTTTNTTTSTTTSVTTPASSDSAHQHAFGVSGVLPPYYALAYIMRIT